jgi:hypothetical protein
VDAQVLLGLHSRARARGGGAEGCGRRAAGAAAGVGGSALASCTCATLAVSIIKGASATMPHRLCAVCCTHSRQARVKSRACLDGLAAGWLRRLRVRRLRGVRRRHRQPAHPRHRILIRGWGRNRVFVRGWGSLCRGWRCWVGHGAEPVQIISIDDGCRDRGGGCLVAAACTGSGLQHQSECAGRAVEHHHLPACAVQCARGMQQPQPGG